MAEYIHNYPGMPEGAKVVMHHLKLDLVACCKFSWREAHIKIALDCLIKTLLPIDEDQRLALLHAPFKEATLFGGELAKLQEANTKHAATFAVFPTPTAPLSLILPVHMSDEEKSFSDRKGPKKPSGRGREQGRPMPTATITRPGQTKEGQPSMTASTPQDSSKRKVEPRDDTSQTPQKNKCHFRGKSRGEKQWWCTPPTTGSSRRETERVSGGVEAYNEWSLCLKYRSQGVQTSFYESTPWEIRSPQRSEEILGMWEQISLIQKNTITEVPPNSPGFYSNVFLVRKASGGWRPVIDLKSLNARISAPHFRMSTTGSFLSTVRKGYYTFKIDLQDAYFHIPIHPCSRKYLRFAFEKQGLPVFYQYFPLVWTQPLRFLLVWANGGRLPPSSGDLGCALSRRLADPPSRSTSFVTTSGPAFRNAGPDRSENWAGPSAGYPVSRNSPTFCSQSPKLRTARACQLSSLVLSSAPTHGLTQLGLRSYPSGSFVPETTTTLLSFFRPDISVYTTASVWPLGPCQLTPAMARPVFSYLWNPYPSFPGRFYDLHGRLHSGLGRPHGGFPNFGYMGPSGPPAPYQLFGTQGSRGCSTSLGPSASGPPGDDRFG